MRSIKTRCLLLAVALSIGGCFDFTANSKVGDDGKVVGDAEIAISTQFAGLAAGLGKDSAHADPLERCGEAPDEANFPTGIRVTRGVRSARGDMLTCTTHFEIDDPVSAARAWRAKALPDDGPMQIPEFSFTRLGDHSYRLAASFQPQGMPKDDANSSNPFAAMFAAAMANHYISVSISAMRIENTTGEISDGGKRVTWKVPVTVLLNPPAGYRQEIRADIIYADDGLWGRLLRYVGLGASQPSPPPPVSLPQADPAQQKVRLAAKLTAYEDQLKQTRATLAEVRAEAELAARQHADQQAMLDSIVFKDPLFRLLPQRYGSDKPLISFSLANNGSTAIKKIFVEGTLQTPGRAVPWIKDTFNHDISGGVEPKETRDFQLAPNIFSNWAKVPPEALREAVLTLKLTAFEDASGKRIDREDAAAAQKKFAARIEELEQQAKGLQANVDDLRKQLQ